VGGDGVLSERGLAPPRFADLRDSLVGTAVGYGEPGWEAARRAWNRAADQRPSLVVEAATAGDVASTVRFAAANGLRVAVQSTGHAAMTLGDLADTILLRTGRLSRVDIDPVRRRARVQAGALWRDVAVAAGRHGLVCLHGLAGTVGVAGYTLGGGIGWLARREGFCAAHVLSFEVVKADGSNLHVDERTAPDLFWALRGGGGRGVAVTAFELRLFDLPTVYAGSLMWPIESAQEVVHAYREWIADLPRELTSTIRLRRFPSTQDVPAPLSGRKLVSVTLAYAGDAERGARLVAPLRAIAQPYLDTLATVPGADLIDVAGDPTQPLPSLGHSRLISRFDWAAAEAYLELGGADSSTPLDSLEIRHLGGALRCGDRDPGAVGAVYADALVFGVGTVRSRSSGHEVLAALAELEIVFAPFGSERRTIPTFDEQERLGAAFAAPTARRLEVIGQAHDPDGLFLANHR
jgi:FAD binding domain